MPLRASFKCCAMTTISSSAAGDPAPPEFASESAASPANAAWAGERGPNKHRKDAATPEAAARIDKLNIRTTPQKLIDDEPLDCSGGSFRKAKFQLEEGGPRLRGWGTAVSIARTRGSELSPASTRTRRGI